MKDVRPLSPPPHVLPGPQEGAPSPHNRALGKRDAPFPEHSNYLLKFLVTGLPRFPNGPLWREAPVSRTSFYPSLKVPDKWAPLHVPQQGAYGEKLHLQSHWFLHLYLSESPVRSPPTKNGENIWTPSTEPYVDGRPTHHGFPKGIVYGTAISTLVPCSLQHDTFHLALGEPEPR